MDLSEVKVSILIPLFNSELYLESCLDSCLNQKHKNIEIIIVDDGSTDSSLIIAKRYERAYSFIKVYHQSNNGAPAARNLAFENCSGDYIQYLDSDDVLSNDKILSQLQLLFKKGNDSLAYTKCHNFIDKIAGSKIIDGISDNYKCPQKLFIDMTNKGWIALHCWLIPRKIIKGVKWNETLLVRQDLAYIGQLIFNSKSVLFCTDGIAYYRQSNPNSIVRQSRTNAFYESESTAYSAVLENFENQPQEIKFQYFKRYCFFYERLLSINSPLAFEFEHTLKEVGFNDKKQFHGRMFKFVSFILGYKNSVRFKFNVINIIGNSNLLSFAHKMLKR